MLGVIKFVLGAATAFLVAVAGLAFMQDPDPRIGAAILGMAIFTAAAPKILSALFSAGKKKGPPSLPPMPAAARRH